jgi:hypothetical protein
MGGVDGGKNRKVAMKNLGLTCVGPTSGSENLIFERCPNEVTIDLDTTRLLSWRGGLRLDVRCVACRFYFEVTNFLTKSGLEVHAEKTVYMFQNCDRQSFHGTARCSQHLSNLISKAHRESYRSQVYRMRWSKFFSRNP